MSDPNVNDHSYMDMEMWRDTFHRWSFVVQLVHQTHKRALFPILPEHHVQFSAEIRLYSFVFQPIKYTTNVQVNNPTWFAVLLYQKYVLPF